MIARYKLQIQFMNNGHHLGRVLCNFFFSIKREKNKKKKENIIESAAKLL